MWFRRSLLAALSLLALAPAKEASASGGYFSGAQSMASAQVSGHRIILSIAEDQTTLWDQISYTGSPESFAWVLPIKGMVEVGVSSDALFNTVDAQTEVIVSPASLGCEAPPFCPLGGFIPAVSVYPGPRPPLSEPLIAREAVGPYETAQLSSEDPDALTAWLTQNGYAIPAEVSPIISAYVAEGYNFLAVKLLPGQKTEAMKPIRVTTGGMNLSLPLRMAAAGAGEAMPVTLFIFGEVQFVPSNYPWASIPYDKLVWDWDRYESNYESVRKDALAAMSNKGWIDEMKTALSYDFRPLQALCSDLAPSSPKLSGYDGDMSRAASFACQYDLAHLAYGAGLVTRLYAELPRDALATDLSLMFNKVGNLNSANYVSAPSNIGTPPPCPSYPPCPSTSTSGGGVDSDGDSSSGCACATESRADASAARFGALIALGLVFARRRTRAARAALP